MKTVVALVALAAMLAATPLVASAPPNECVTTGAQACVPVDLSTAHMNQPGLSSLPYFDVFYVWVGPGQCANPVSDTCNGQPSGQDGIAMPDNSGTIPTAGLFSTLYQETNGAGGLQRLRVPSAGHIYMPDRTVLV